MRKIDRREGSVSTRTGVLLAAAPRGTRLSGWTGTGHRDERNPLPRLHV